MTDENSIAFDQLQADSTYRIAETGSVFTVVAHQPGGDHRRDRISLRWKGAQENTVRYRNDLEALTITEQRH